MNRLPSLLASVAFLSLGLPTLASAQSQAYVASSRTTQAPSCLPVPVKGTVMVQVLVHPDATFAVQRVISSTNPADNDAALDIARHSSYAAATRNGKPVEEFNDFAIEFTEPLPGIAKSVDVCNAYAQIRAGQYADARSGLAAYIVAHPDDQEGYLFLGVAAGFAKDYSAAVVAFDKVANIPDRFLNLVVESYQNLMSDKRAAGAFADVLPLATRVMQLAPKDPNAPYLRGLSEIPLKRYPAAVADIENAFGLLAAAKLSDADRAGVGENLLAAYLLNGDMEKAKALIPVIKTLDPNAQARIDTAIFMGVVGNANTLLAAGNYAASVTELEAGTTLLPSEAVNFYHRALGVLSSQKPIDWKKIKAEAEKALAVDKTDGLSNFYKGLALNNGENNPKGALPFLKLAKSSSAYSSDTSFAKQVDTALKALDSAN